MTTHINPETGEHGTCNAKIKCPFQKKGEELGIVTHFNTVREAKAAGEKIQESLYGTFGTLDKNTPKPVAKKTVAKPKVITITSNQEALNILAETNEEISPEQWKKIADFYGKNPNDVVAKRMLNRSDLNEYALKKLIKQKGLTEFLTSEKLPAALYDALAGMKMNQEQQYTFTKNKKVPKSALEIMLPKMHTKYLDNLIKHPNCDVQLADQAVENAINDPQNYSYIYQALLGTNKFSKKSIEMMMTNKTRFYVDLDYLAQHKLCPPDLAAEINELNKYNQMVATNSVSAADVDEVLSEDFVKKFPRTKYANESAIKNLRMRAYRNDNLSDETIKRLFDEDDGTDVKYNYYGVLYNLSNQVHGIKDKKIFNELYNEAINHPDTIKNRALYPLLARSEAATEAQLTNIANICSDYAKYDNWQHRRFRENTLEYVAKNPNTSPQLLKRMTTHRLLDVKTAAAENPNTPTELLDRLSALKQGSLFSALVKNPKLSLQAQKNIIANPLFSEKYNSNYRENFLKNPGLDPKILDILADSPDSKIVEMVKKHPRTSMKTLLKLGGANAED